MSQPLLVKVVKLLLQSLQTIPQEVTSSLCVTSTNNFIFNYFIGSRSKIISFQPSIFSPLFQVIFWSFNRDRILPFTGCRAKRSSPDVIFV